MKFEYLILAVILLWFAVEQFVSSRGVRVFMQFALFLGFSIAAFALGSRLGGFGPTLKANNHLKNLTRGLATITSSEDLDLALLRENLEDLDESVLATYETQVSSREAVERFLSAYGIVYEEEIPIGVDVSKEDYPNLPTDNSGD